MAYCGTFPGTCGHKADCPDRRCPGVAIGRERELARLMVEIADEAARSDVECFALTISVPPQSAWPVYDVARLAPELPNDDDLLLSYQQSIAKAFRYLDLRGLLHFPVKGARQFVSFGVAP